MCHVTLWVARKFFRFPETNLGIFPGPGGSLICQIASKFDTSPDASKPSGARYRAANYSFSGSAILVSKRSSRQFTFSDSEAFKRVEDRRGLC